jgi:hypothetical protein
MDTFISASSSQRQNKPISLFSIYTLQRSDRQLNIVSDYSYLHPSILLFTFRK